MFGVRRFTRTPLLVVALAAAATVAGSNACGAQQGFRPPVPSPPQRRSVDVGAYFFGGWSGPTNGFHFNGLTSDFTNREPFYGWRDDGARDMSEQLAWAHAFGISFFVFDWYADGTRLIQEDPHLNDALHAYESLPQHHDVGFALMYVNSRGGTVAQEKWPDVLAAWTRLFADPNYVRVAGKPILVIYDSLALAQQLGGTAGVNHLFAALRASARARGLPGVFIIGGVYVGSRFDWGSFPRLLEGQTYDALTQYAYPAVAGAEAGQHCYCELIAAEQRIWQDFATRSPWSYIPSVMAGWDPRPWRERVEGSLFWFSRTPAAFARFVRSAARWSKSNRGRTTTNASGNPILLVEAWNELGEGSFIVPTRGSGDAYGEALRRAVSVVG